MGLSSVQIYGTVCTVYMSSIRIFMAQREATIPVMYVLNSHSAIIPVIESSYKHCPDCKGITRVCRLTCKICFPDYHLTEDQYLDNGFEQMPMGAFSDLGLPSLSLVGTSLTNIHLTNGAIGAEFLTSTLR